MPQWLVPVLIAVVSLIFNGLMLMFVIGRFTGKYTEALSAVVDRLNKLDEDKGKQWTEIDQQGKALSFIQGQLSRANGKAGGSST